MNEEIINELNKLFDTDLTINDMEKDIEEVIEWDSYEAVLFIHYIEENYEKKVLLTELVKFHKIIDLVEAIKSRR